MPSDLSKAVASVRKWIFNTADGGQIIQTPHELQRFFQEYQQGGALGPVTEAQAMRVSAVFACVRLLSDSVAMLPLCLFRKQDGKNVCAEDDPTHFVLAVRPNSWQTPYEFKRMLMAHALLKGNFYAKKNMWRGRVTDLIPLNPGLMRVEQEDDGELVYLYHRPNNSVLRYRQKDIFHVRNLCVDGVRGLSTLEAARNSVGVSIKTEQHAASLFSNGVRPSGVLESPDELSDDAYERMRKDFEEKYVGSENAYRPMILEGGVTWKQMTMTAEDSQFIDQRKYSVAEIARFFGVPPHAIGDIDRGTSWGSGIEQQNVAFLIHTLGPYLVNIEQTCIRDLVPSSDQTNFVVKFDTSLLTRPDFGTRQTGYQIMKRNGVVNANEWRKAEGLEPIEGAEADAYRTDASGVPGSSPDQAAGQGEDEASD